LKYKYSYECVVRGKNMARESSIKHKKWREEGGSDVEALGGGAGRVMVAIPGKETLERCRGESIKANYSLMSLTSVIKAQSCST